MTKRGTLLMTRRKRLWLVVAASLGVLIAVFFASAQYGIERYHGIYYVSRPPVAVVTWGPAGAYIVQHGVNLVGDLGIGQAGNVIEFPVSRHTRVSMRLFSFRWFAEELQGWKSDHGFLDPKCTRRTADRGAANGAAQCRG